MPDAPLNKDSPRAPDLLPKNVLSGFAYYLAERQLLNKDIALKALEQATANKQSYIDVLLKEKLLNEPQIARTTSEYFGLPLLDIDGFNAKLIPNEYLTIQAVKKRTVLPLFKKNGLLFLATADPTAENLYEIKFLTGLDIRLVVVEANKLATIIDEIMNTLLLSEMQGTTDTDLKSVEVESGREEDAELSTYDVESAPIVNYVNKVLLDAVTRNASDIHFEHFENNFRIRYRQHGILYPITSPPLKIANYIMTRLKIMSDLDITEHRIPQDGRFKLIISKKKGVDFRVSICPTLFGEKAVLRILDTSRTLQNLNNLGMSEIQEENFINALQKSQGMILVTGPTGSGKTVTLYSALQFLNSTEKNISTVKEPVEIPVPGINQVNVNPKTNLTFSTALRSFLRQDPDIIMVGEIRDLETAEIAVKASQTGHLVLSTLHTNSATETVTRLMSMGVEPYNLASSLIVVIAQRLLRVLCNKCKVSENLPEDVLIKEGFHQHELSKLKIYTAVGCDYCTHGFTGRIGIFEVMPISIEMAQLIMRGANALEINELAKKEGITDLRESGLQKVREGLTSLAELNRVFK